MQREVEDATAAADSELRGRQEAEKVLKNLELQLSELQSKADEQSRLLNDFSALKNRLQHENGDLSHQVSFTIPFAVHTYWHIDYTIINQCILGRRLGKSTQCLAPCQVSIELSTRGG